MDEVAIPYREEPGEAQMEEKILNDFTFIKQMRFIIIYVAIKIIGMDEIAQGTQYIFWGLMNK